MYSERMPFGKYKGRQLDETPADYLLWCLKNCWKMRGLLRSAIENELDRRQEHDRRTGYDERPNYPVKWGPIIQAWYRELCLAWHPDRGGSHQAMQAIVDAKERLEKLVGI